MGRKGNSGMSGGPSTAARGYWDNLSTSGPNKYTALQYAADGNRSVLDSAVGRLSEGRSMTDAQKDSLRSALQEQARRWLSDNPKPRNPRKEGYTWNGKKYVRL